jgi:hypothetical protein
MAGENPVARASLLENCGPVKTPVRVMLEFFVPFVGVVHGMEKSLGVAHMDRHRDAELAAFLPRRVEPGIVHPNQFAGLITYAQAEVFQDFQSSRATRNRIA